MMMLWRVQSSLTKIRGYFNVGGVGLDSETTTTTREPSIIKRGRNEVDYKDIASQGSFFYPNSYTSHPSSSPTTYSSYNCNCNYNCSTNSSSNSPVVQNHHHQQTSSKYKKSSRCSVATTSKTMEISIKNENNKNNNVEVVEPATPRLVDRIPCRIRSYHHHRNSSLAL